MALNIWGKYREEYPENPARSVSEQDRDRLIFKAGHPKNQKAHADAQTQESMGNKVQFLKKPPAKTKKGRRKRKFTI